MAYYLGASSSSSSSSSSSTTVKDRSAEFRSYVAHHKAANASGAVAAPASRKPPTKGEFARKAAAIGKDISDTTVKLGRLAELARKKSLFDDRPVEISELTYIIKHDLAAINRQLADLQAQSKGKAGQQAGKKGKDRAEEHRGNVVTLLQSNLASATTAFQDVLEVRTQVGPRGVTGGPGTIEADLSPTLPAALAFPAAEHESFARSLRAVCLLGRNVWPSCRRQFR